MHWPRAVLTDSGGYQVYSLAALRRIREDGVDFRSHLDGSRRFLSPEKAVDIQLALGSDVMMVLDDCTRYPAEEPEARRSMELTLRWADRSFARWRATAPEGRQMLFPIVQGSMYPALRRECAERLVDLDAAGYAVGGLSVGEPRPLSYEMTAVCEQVLPRSRPRYAMGVGMPSEIGEYVALGIDMMDCVLPTRNARNGCLFTAGADVRIKNAVHARGPRPRGLRLRVLHLPQLHAFLSSAPVSRGRCSTPRSRRSTTCGTTSTGCAGSAPPSSTIHNLWHYLDRMRRIRAAIVAGTFPRF